MIHNRMSLRPNVKIVSNNHAWLLSSVHLPYNSQYAPSMQQVRSLVASAESGGFLLLIGFDAEAQGIIWEGSKTLSSQNRLQQPC